MEFSDTVKPHTDWSKATRKKLSLLKLANDPDQTKITKFFDLLTNVTSLIDKNPTMVQECQSKEKFNVLFKRLILNAEKNLQKHPQQVRHDILLKKFAASLFIYCGSRAYNFISSNMPRALPCLRTVQRFVATDYSPIHEGCFRFDEIMEHLKAFKCPNIVSVGEDATRVIKKVQYDAETDKLVGFVLLCDKEGLLLCDSFMATSFESMQKYFSEESIANYAFVYMVQPLTENVPAFCLSCIETDNKFTTELVLKRWQYIYSELKKTKCSSYEFCSRW